MITNKKQIKYDMHIFFASDENFVKHLTSAIASILKNALITDYHHFYILEDNISEHSKEKILNLNKIKKFDIEFIKVDNELFKDCPHIPACKHITMQTYYRYIIPKIKPNLDKVLYLDCDIIVKKSLSSLYNIDLKDYYCAVVQELSPKWSPKDEKRLGINAEFNAGVILINNKKWKEENLLPVFFENTQKLYNQGILKWQDQDVLNYTFGDKVIWVNPQFNFQQNAYSNPYYTKYTNNDMEYAKKNIVIIHYNNPNKPWNLDCDFYPWDYYFSLFLANYKKDAIILMIHYIFMHLFFINKNNQRVNVNILGLKFSFKRKKYSIDKIFSIKNEESHKVISLFGFKIKLKNKPLVYSVPYKKPLKTYKTLVSTTGFGHSGSGAILDYLSEFSNTTVFGFHDPCSSGYNNKENDIKISEIDFFRVAGSVLDMERNFCYPNYFNDSFCIKYFLHVAEYFYRKGIIYTDYFWELTHKFIDDITDLKIKTHDGFEGLYFLKLKYKRKRYANLVSPLTIESLDNDRYIYYLKKLSTSEYRSIANEYITKFLNSIESKDFLICDQILTTSAPDIDRKIEYFGDFKQIVVWRDPRDVYVTGILKDEQWIPKNPEDFVKWYYQRGTPAYVNVASHPNILLIRFEDLVINYDEISKKINNFIGIDEEKHINKKQYFNPDISINNIGIYKNYKNQNEIKYIEAHLKEYCYFQNINDNKVKKCQK